MSYISVNFIYFLLAFLLLYSVVKSQPVKRVLLLLGNLYFYCMAGGPALLIVLVSALAVYGGAILIDKAYAGYRDCAQSMTPPEKLKLLKQYKRKTIGIVTVVLVLILGVLCFVKLGRYLGWEKGSTEAFLFGGSLVVPLGISYYTLSMTGYLIDVYRDKIKCERNLLSFLAGVTFFPHIIQGPISRYDNLLKQIKSLPTFCYESLCSGLQLMLWGYLKKLVLADTIALYTTQVFSHAAGYSVRSIAVATFLYAVQLYADFSGCIDIVSGIGEAMGITLDKNFERPFFSKSAGEFWRRWHISLGTWFKDYIYMPIATAGWFKNITKKLRKNHGRQLGMVVSVSVPSMAVWFLTGLWHGTGLDYIFWGLYWGILIILSEILSDRFEAVRMKLHMKDSSRWVSLFRQGRTFLIYCIGLLIIMKSSVPVVQENIERTASENAVIVVGTIFLFVVELLQERLAGQGETLRGYLASKHIVIRWTVYFAGIILLILFGRFGIGYNADAFIYAGF